MTQTYIDINERMKHYNVTGLSIFVINSGQIEQVENYGLLEEGTNKKVTLRNLLSHQSGIMDPEDSFMELDTNEGIPSLVKLLSGMTPYCKAPIEVKYEPESDFQYSDAGFCIIQQMIEDVIVKPFERVWKN